MTIFSPLNQFDVFIVWNLNLGKLFFFINNLNLVLFSVVVFFFLTYFILGDEITIIPKKIQFNFEEIYLFVYRLITTQVGIKALYFFPILFTMFFMVWALNLVALLPYSFAVTSHFSFSLYLSLSICFGIFLLGLIKHQLNYLKIFIQRIPIILYPLMTSIELSSYSIRGFSLSIRLSANVLAGHILVDLIAEVISFLNLLLMEWASALYGLLGGLFVLEIGVSCLQAYILILLVSIYLVDAVVLHLHI